MVWFKNTVKISLTFHSKSKEKFAILTVPDGWKLCNGE